MEENPTQTPIPLQPSVQPEPILHQPEVVQPVAAQPQVPPVQPSSKSNAKIVLSGLFVVVLLVLVGTGSVLYLGGNSKSTPKYTAPTVTNNIKSAPTPVPTLPQADITSKSVTDTQLDKDVEAINSSLDSLNSDTQAIDVSLLDQQANLQ
jgi:hypothetical protein